MYQWETEGPIREMASIKDKRQPIAGAEEGRELLPCIGR